MPSSIRRDILTLAMVVTLGVPGVARADWFTGTTKVFSLAWNTVANWSQYNADGTQVAGSGAIEGTGSLAVTKLADHYEFGFGFSGDGQLVLGGTFPPGARNWDGSPLPADAMWIESYPAPAGSLIKPAGSPYDSWGTWSLDGQDRFALSYTDAPHSNTFGVNGWSRFEATAYTPVSEPAVLLIVAAGLLGAARLARWRLNATDAERDRRRESR